jgi:hypothetical protein
MSEETNETTNEASEPEEKAHPEPTVDPKELRRAVLQTTEDWVLLDDIQGDVIALRERAGIARPHVPTQMVRATCDELVEDGRLEVEMVEIQGGEAVPSQSDKARPRFRRRQDDAATARRRRAAILRHLLPLPDKEGRVAPEATKDAHAIVAALGEETIIATERLVTEDLFELTKARSVVPNTVAGVTLWTLREQASAELLAIGADALALRSLSEADAAASEVATAEQAAPEPASVDPEEAQRLATFQQRQQEALEAQREARARAEADREKLAAFLVEKNIDPNEILGRKVKQPRKTFEWTQARIVDLEEKGVIFEEVRKLEAKIAECDLAFDGAKSRYKAEKSGIELEIQALKDAADCNQRILKVVAYRDPDWDAGVDIIRAAEDDRELAREDIVRGTQKTIPGTDAPKPKADPATGDAGEAPSALGALPVAESADATAPAEPAEKQPLTDFEGAVLAAFRDAVGPLNEETLTAALAAAWICPEGYEALTRMTVSRLVADKKLKLVQGKERSWMLLGAPVPPKAKPKPAAAVAVAEDDGASTSEEDGEDEADENDGEDDEDEEDGDDDFDPEPEPQAAPPRRGRVTVKGQKPAPEPKPRGRRGKAQKTEARA